MDMNPMSSASPKVSVIIPTYNRADLLPKTIKSVLAQTFTDLEILVVDDGSTDDTEQAVQHIGDSRVIYVRQAHSGLPAVARNTGLRGVRGEYIAFLDSDDLWLSDKLALQVEYMDGHPSIGLVYSNSYRFTDDPNQLDPRPMLGPGEGISGYAFDQLYGKPKIPSLTVMIRASVTSDVGIFDEDERLKTVEDYEYWLRIAYRYPVGYVNKPLGKYRQHTGCISRSAVACHEAKLILISKLDRLYPEFVARHPHKRKRWLSQVHYSFGRALLRENRVDEAQGEFRSSWRVDHRLSALFFLVASFLGKSVCQSLDGAKTRLRKA